MKQNQSVNRLRKSLLAGIASVSLVAVGCGGGGNGTVTPQTISGTSAGISSLLLSKGNADLVVYAQDGTVLTTGTLSNGGITITSNTLLDQNAYYAVTASAKSNPKANVPVLAKGSELLNAGGHMRFAQYGLARTFLAEKELSRVAGTDVVLGQAGTNFSTSAELTAYIEALDSGLSASGSSLSTVAFEINSLASQYFVTDDARQVNFATLYRDYLNNPGASFSFAKVQAKSSTGDFSGFASVGTVGSPRYFTGVLATQTAIDNLRRAFAVSSSVRSLSRVGVRASGSQQNTLKALLSRIAVATPIIADTDIPSANLVSEVAEMAQATGNSAANSMLTAVLAGVTSNGAPTQSTVLEAVSQNIVNVATQVASNPDFASKAVDGLGRLIGGVLSSDANRATASTFTSAVQVASNLGGSLAQRVAGGLLEAASRQNSTAAAIPAVVLNQVRTVGNIALDGAGLGNYIVDALTAVSRVTGQLQVPVAQILGQAIKSMETALTGAAILAEKDAIVAKAQGTDLGLSAAELETVLKVDNRTIPFVVKLAGEASRTIRLIPGTSTTLVFDNGSLDVGQSPRPTYTWAHSVSGVTVETATTSPSQLTLTVQLPANQTSGSVNVTLTGKVGTGNPQTATAGVTVSSNPVFVTVQPSATEVFTGANFTASVYVKVPAAAQAVSVVVTSAVGGSGYTTELTQAQAINGLGFLANLVAPSAANNSVEYTVQVAGVTQTPKFNIKVNQPALVPTISNVSNTSFSSGTTAAVVFTGVAVDQFATPATMNVTWTVFSGADCSGNPTGEVTATVNAASFHNLTATTNVVAGFHCVRLDVRTVNATAHATKTFTVVDTTAPQIGGVQINGQSFASSSSSLFTTVNPASPLLYPIGVNYTSATTATAVTATVNGGAVQTLGTITANSASGSITLVSGQNQVAVYVTANSKTTVYVFTVQVQQSHELDATSFTLDGTTVTHSVSGTTATLTTGTAVMYNNNLHFKVNTGAYVAGTSPSVMLKKLTVKVEDIGSSTKRTAIATLNNVVISRSSSNTSWQVTATGDLSASVTRQNGDFAMGTKSNSEFRDTAFSGTNAWFTGDATSVQINLTKIKDYLAGTNGIAGGLPTNLTSLSGATLRVTVEIEADSTIHGSVVRVNGSPVSTITVNGITVQ
ncbi:MAG: hypothetical protein H3C47_11970 [Candidatus Cloacimonetes bacterium]|nr:hypothetical protein [Candidatus Cloacimonadota bacterium]